MDIVTIFALVTLLTLPTFFFGLYTYLAAGEVVTAFHKGQDQKTTDHWVPLLSVGYGLGWFGGWALYIAAAGALNLELTNAVTSNMLAAGLAGSFLSTWLTMKSVRQVISCHYPGTTFTSSHYFFIKELGSKRARATAGFCWVNNLL